MKRIALNRLNILSAARGKGLASAQKLSLLNELAQMGYRISNPEKLNEVSSNFMMDYKHLTDILNEKRGGNKPHIGLFQNFPDTAVDDISYLTKRFIGFIANDPSLASDSIRLSNGTLVPKWLFNIYEFGADPITQMQSDDLFSIALKKQDAKKGDTHVEWIDLTLLDEDDTLVELSNYLNNILYAKSSVKVELHSDIEKLIGFFGLANVDTELVVFKETKALVLKMLWNAENYDAINKLAYSATDVLRMFAAVTDTDISLSDKIRFPKMKRKARKAILTILETSNSLAEDIKNYSGIWLEIGRYLHPGEYAKQFPKTAKVFKALRNGKIETFASVTEKLLFKDNIGGLLNHLSAKPGVFARKLHEVLRRFPFEYDEILVAFESEGHKLQLKNVLIMVNYFKTINDSTYRTVINKRGKIKVLENNAFGGLSEDILRKVLDVLNRIMFSHLSSKESWDGKKVWIDEALKNYTVPLQQRAASDGMITAGRGSRIEIDLGKVMRLFIYWKEAGKRTDLDLSVLQMDADFNYVGHVSYTNLRASGIAHSGDIQSAPLGAAEFVDITMSSLTKGVKYLAVQINRYCGNSFAEMDCHAGWMVRDTVNADARTFDIKTVANKYDLNGTGAYAIPLILAIAKAQIVLTDLYVAGRAIHNNVEGSFGNVTLLCSQIAEFVKTKPTMLELATNNALARRAWVIGNKENADLTIGLTAEDDFNALDVERVLTEFI